MTNRCIYCGQKAVITYKGDSYCDMCWDKRKVGKGELNRKIVRKNKK